MFSDIHHLQIGVLQDLTNLFHLQISVTEKNGHEVFERNFWDIESLRL